MRLVDTRATRRHVTRDCRTVGPARHDRANPMLPPNPPDRGPKDQRLPPVSPQVAPTAAERRAGEPASAARRVRISAEAKTLPHCTTTACTRAIGHPSRCSSANDRICPSCSMPRTDRADVAADALGPSSSRFIASSEPYRQAMRSAPGRSEPQPGVARREPKPAPPVGNEAAKKLGRPSDIPVRCHHRATAWLPRELHSSGTCRPGEPFRRAPEPHTSRSWKQCHVKTASVSPPSQPPRGTCGAEDPQIQRHFA